jgi:hypothetical protein
VRTFHGIPSAGDRRIERIAARADEVEQAGSIRSRQGMKRATALDDGECAAVRDGCAEMQVRPFVEVDWSDKCTERVLLQLRG